MSSFYGRPSCYLLEDELGEIHDIQQGEGREQGDALMPMSSLGLHEALVAVASQLNADEELVAFLDDIYVILFPRTCRRHSLPVAAGVVEAQSNIPPPWEDSGLEPSWF